MTRDLAARYRALLWAYPAAYRAERGDEIVGTYLDLARPGQRRPRLADATDLLAGGLRQRLRAGNSLGLADALPFAGTVALAAAAALAALWLVVAETVPEPRPVPLVTVGRLVWVAWLLAAAAAGAGRARTGVGLALLITAATALTTLPRPPMFLLLPQLALGVLALAAPARSRRLCPAVTAALAAAGAVPLRAAGRTYYDLLVYLPLAATVLAAAVVVAGLVFTARRDPRAWWPALILLGPVLLLLLSVQPFARQGPPWTAFGPAVVEAVAAAGIAVTAAAATLWLRAARPAPPPRCPTCGR